jgi:glycosyl transferase family 2
MKIVVSLGVKDEVDLIASTLEHLFAIGVDFVVVCDLESSDGTTDVLERYRSRGKIWHFQLGQHASHEEWERANLELLAQTDADWIVFLDADEFPVPATGQLRDSAAFARADVVTLDRFNVPLGSARPTLPERLTREHYDELMLVVHPVAEFWERLKTAPNLPWLLGPILPRVAARPDCIAGITLGAHDVVPPAGRPVRRERARDLVVAHVPFTTGHRFARKVANIRESLGVHSTTFPEGSAPHWRRWAALPNPETVQEEFERMLFDPRTMAALRNLGVIRSASEHFSRQGNVRPDAAPAEGA